jgi:hypothetical protein
MVLRLCTCRESRCQELSELPARRVGSGGQLIRHLDMDAAGRTGCPQRQCLEHEVIVVGEVQDLVVGETSRCYVGEAEYQEIRDVSPPNGVAAPDQFNYTSVDDPGNPPLRVNPRQDGDLRVVNGRERVEQVAHLLDLTTR